MNVGFSVGNLFYDSSLRWILDYRNLSSNQRLKETAELVSLLRSIVMVINKVNKQIVMQNGFSRFQSMASAS